jgi:hypothetical protein
MYGVDHLQNVDYFFLKIPEKVENSAQNVSKKQHFSP